jgi:hypothetical protein
MAKKRRTAKQKAATAKMLADNKAKRSKGRFPKQDNVKWAKAAQKKRTTPKKGKKVSVRALHARAKATNHVPLDVLKRRAVHSAETLVREARKAGITNLDQIPEYRPKGRRRSRR